MAQNGKTVEITDANFASEVEQDGGLALVDFWATWCGPCRMVAPILEELAGEYEGKVKVGKLDVDANQQTAVRFGVRSIPTIMFFKGGEHGGHRGRRGAQAAARAEDQGAPRLIAGVTGRPGS
jgi:thioredoxin 1